MNIYKQAISTLSAVGGGSVRDILRFAVSRFNEADLVYGQGTDNAHDEAVYLILSALHLPIETLDPYLDARLLPDEIKQVIDLIEQRVIKKTPVAYLTHKAWQGEFDFYVDERVIVPRSFIYEVLGDPLLPWIEYPELIHNALDLCSGSGALAIQLAYHYPDVEIDAVDISLDALEVAAINVKRYSLENQINLIHSDLFFGLEKRYDLIISNPPYVDADSVANLPDEYLHEPKLALGSGEDGLDITRKIIEQAHEYLTDNGILVVEIGHNRQSLEEHYPQLPFVWLKTNSGDGFVFLLRAQDLAQI